MHRELREPRATEWSAARLAAKECVRRLLDLNGDEPVEVETDARGVPWALAGLRRVPLSLSHAEGWAVAAAHPRLRVGIDVEPLRPIPDEHTRYFLDAAESAVLEAWTDPASASLAAWTIKEAVLKATGRGLEVAPARVRIGSLDARGDARVVLGAMEFAASCVPQDGALVSVACRSSVHVPPLLTSRSRV